MSAGIFAITRQGLIALTLSVAALWTCVGMEALTRRQTNRDIAASMQTLARLRRITEGQPSSTPARAPEPAFHWQRAYTS
jgi:hypothetical protein